MEKAILTAVARADLIVCAIARYAPRIMLIILIPAIRLLWYLSKKK